MSEGKPFESPRQGGAPLLMINTVERLTHSSDCVQIKL